ncbi:hypothetical protein TNCV_360051 [Trichonephila clavipes]|uniref:Uncharacterized protein n=1 Tax=Trichonephila clavipes TaxID=2585209 RepID=A0A8X6SES9_TRICX|nr:hypothetical protein TNCV_360051 [Trichonephila clavipes]
MCSTDEKSEENSGQCRSGVILIVKEMNTSLFCPKEKKYRQPQHILYVSLGHRSALNTNHKKPVIVPEGASTHDAARWRLSSPRSTAVISHGFPIVGKTKA